MNITDERKERAAGMSERQFRDFVVDSFEDGSHKFTELKHLLEANTALTKKNVEDTREMIEVFGSMKGGFKVLGWLGAFAKWTTAVIVAIAGTYTIIKQFFHIP